MRCGTSVRRNEDELCFDVHLHKILNKERNIECKIPASNLNSRKMPHYYKAGTIPHKRHTQFRKPNGELYSEQLFSTEGFSSDYSLLYHSHPPTVIIKTEEP